MRTHADDVLELTVQLLRAMSRTGTYEPTHPNYERARPKLHKELVRLLRIQPEIAFVTAPPSIAGGPHELHVDGTAPNRVDIRRIIPQSMGGAFALQLLQSMQQRDIVMLAFRKAVTVEELLAFLDLWADGADGAKLDRTFREQKNRNIVVVTSRALLPDEEIPWHARVALSRLTHDLLLREGDWKPTFEGVCEELVGDAVRPFLRQAEALFTILGQAPKADAQAARDVDVRRVKLRNVMVEGLPRIGVFTLISTGLRVAGQDEVRRELLRLCGERLVRDEPSRERDRALRSLAGAEILPLDRLPQELQEWVRAELWVEAYETHGESPPTEIGVLTKAIPHALELEKFSQANAALYALRTLDPDEALKILTPEIVQLVVERFPAEAKRRDEIFMLFNGCGDAVLDMVADACARYEGKPSESAARILAKLIGAGGLGAARRALQKGVEGETGAKMLLAIVGAKVERSLTPILVRYTTHKAAVVRRDALSLLTTADPETADAYVAKGFADEDSAVRIRALTICSATGLGSKQILSRVMDLILKDASKSDPGVVAAAIDVVSKTAARGGMLSSDAEEAFCKLVGPAGLFDKVMCKEPLPPQVLTAGIMALATFNTPKAQKTLEKLEKDKDPTIAQIARDARAQRSASRPPPPMK